MQWRHMGSGCIDPHILHLGTNWRWVISFMPRPLPPQERGPGTLWIGGWVGPRTGLEDVERRKILPLLGLKTLTALPWSPQPVATLTALPQLPVIQCIQIMCIQLLQTSLSHWEPLCRWYVVWNKSAIFAWRLKIKGSKWKWCKYIDERIYVRPFFVFCIVTCKPLHNQSKVKQSLCLTNQALQHEDIWGSGCIDLCILDSSTSWRWVVSFTPRPFYPRGKSSMYLSESLTLCF
jgi:hypothetical protein